MATEESAGDIRYPETVKTPEKPKKKKQKQAEAPKDSDFTDEEGSKPAEAAEPAKKKARPAHDAHHAPAHSDVVLEKLEEISKQLCALTDIMKQNTALLSAQHKHLFEEEDGGVLRCTTCGYIRRA